MAKIQTRYVCQSCAYESPRWVGKCPNCAEWNTFVEEVSERASAKKSPGRPHGSSKAVALAGVALSHEERISSGITEFDRVMGGGIVLGSVTLLGGDPGVGKSTLMLQLAAALRTKTVLYVSGEESARQIKLRADRLACAPGESLLLLSETNAEVIAELVDRTPPDLIIVDSIQTMYRAAFESSPGSVGQVRESTALFTRLAKERSIPVFLIGHVTKEGVIAGPKVIEHMVDTVLQFEGDRHYAYRILRAMKNRYGSTNEIGVFEMRDTGLREVTNPSEVFLSERSIGASGSAVVASMEGSRPILIEVQALVTPTNFNVPQRNTTGFDYRRLNLLLAVLEKRAGVRLGQQDVFVNIAGGVRIDEPAVDLGIAAAIVSSLRDAAMDPQVAGVGEIGLSGEVRAVSQAERRVQEAAKLGFKRFILPANNLKGLSRVDGITLVGVETIDEALDAFLRP
jgi:DNA repair protein RadA/Sms